jgi:hypothetical protein
MCGCQVVFDPADFPVVVVVEFDYCGLHGPGDIITTYYPNWEKVEPGVYRVPV